MWLTFGSGCPHKGLFFLDERFCSALYPCGGEQVSAEGRVIYAPMVTGGSCYEQAQVSSL